MPLFICEKCQTIENTALCLYWETIGTDNPALCSECDPELLRWHGVFKKAPFESLPKPEQERVLNPPVD